MPAAEAVTRADRMLAGRYDILGYRDVRLRHAARLAPGPGARPSSRLRLSGLASRTSIPQFGDHKIIWEINRHQHWLGLGRAYQLTRDRRYYDSVRRPARGLDGAQSAARGGQLGEHAGAGLPLALVDLGTAFLRPGGNG